MKKYFTFFLASIWLATVGFGMGVLLVYANTPGKVGNVPTHWPVQSKIPRVQGKPTLVMFAHPKCPCTRASIGELSVLMTHCQNQVCACVVFLRPTGSGEDWRQTDLWESAEAIPGVAVRSDEAGNEASRFQVTTSGHVVLYDADGRLLFSGGITASRGHSGDNTGRTSILELIHHERADSPVTPVFGCSLFDPKGTCSAKETLCPR